MAFDVKQSSIEIRNLLLEESPALAGLALPRIQAMIPIMLESYASESFSDPRKRQQFKKKVTIALASGEKDLTTYIDGTTSKIYLPDVPRTTIYLSSTNLPFTWVGSREQLKYARIGSTDAPAIFLDGYILYTKNNQDGATDTLAGNIYLTVPVYPAVVAEIPVTLQKDFIIFGTNFIRQQVSVQAGGGN